MDTASNGPAADTFEKALALATALADRERDSLTRSYDRFFQLVKWAAILIGILLTFLGFGTLHELRRETKNLVSAEVKAEMPRIVREEVARQFEESHVRDIAESEIRKETGSQIQQLVIRQVSDAIAAELKRQKDIIRLAVGDQIIHHLSTSQAYGLTEGLKQIGPYPIRLLTDTDQNREIYAGEIANAFRKAGWGLQGESYSAVPDSTHGVYVGKLTVNGKIDGGLELSARLINALKKSGLPTVFGGQDQATIRGGGPCFTLQIWETNERNVSVQASH